ncbi:hypothetical protein C9374_009569 [Naegleria lovaniensis]|uniref:C2 domain-containing protein n=1 Tax=Naegleria lovaniensis TaxID=51637 RepID=A0AA88KR78_NAELO|nr:uncharacterized protein C9374_009569 [Naegleria lovaniensis]KAG2392992.1 hypothetical protein C9374_009569 [Naegleria lovaniensis]
MVGTKPRSPNQQPQTQVKNGKTKNKPDSTTTNRTNSTTNRKINHHHVNNFNPEQAKNSNSSVTLNHTTASSTVSNVASSDVNITRNHPFFVQGKDEPLLAESLPPLVRGQCLGEVFLCIHAIKWVTNTYQNYSIHPVWWGSEDRTISLYPPVFEETPHKDELCKIAVRYPVKTPEDVFRMYLSNSKVLPLVIVHNENQVIAEASIPIVQISSSNAIQKEWFSAKRGTDVVANLLITLALDYFVPNTPQLKDNTKRAVHFEEAQDSHQPVHLPIQPSLSEKHSTQSFTSNPSHAQSTTSEGPTIQSVDLQKSSNLDGLLQHAQQLSNEVNQFLTEGKVPFIDYNAFREMKESTDEVPFFLKDNEDDDNFSASVSTISPRESFDIDPKQSMTSEMLEIENSLNQLSHFNKNIVNPIPFYPPNYPSYPYLLPPPIPPSSTQPPTILKPKSEQEFDSTQNSDESRVITEPVNLEKKERSPPVIAHLHAHIHVDDKEEQKKQRFGLMLHIISAKLTKPIGNKDTCKIKLDIKMPFGKRGSSEQQIVVVYNQDIRVNTYEVFSFSNQKVFLPKFRDCSLVLETFDDSDNFMGLSLFSLTSFFEAFSFEQPPKYLFPDKEDPVIGHYGAFTSTNPITDEVVLEMNCVLAFGTETQVKGFVNSQRAAMTIQDFVRSSLSKSKDKPFVEEPPQDEEYEIQHENILKPLPLLHKKTKTSSKQNRNEVNIDDARDDYEDTEIVFEEENNKAEVRHENDPQMPSVPKCIPLPVLSSLCIRVNRASGLKDAAITCGTYNSHMRAASQVGVNPFVEFEDITSGKEIRTPVLASTFCPVWEYEHVSEFLLDEVMYHNINHGELIFRVFHRIPQSRITSNTASNTVELGKVIVPLRTLLTNKQGISGWFDVYSHDESVVGTIDLEMFFDDQTIRSLFLKETSKKEPLRQSYPYPICRFTLIIEETNIPTQVLEELVPFYMLEENQSVPCYLFVTYRFYGEKNSTESRLYKTSTSLSKTIMHHSCEFKKVLDPTLTNSIEQEKLAIQVYCSIDNGRDQDEQSIRKRAKLIGSVYIDISNLVSHSNGSKTLFISGLYNIVNTESESLNHGSIKMKVSSEQINFGVAANNNTPHQQKPVIRSSGTQANIDLSIQSDDDYCGSIDAHQDLSSKEPEMTLEEKELHIAQDDLIIQQPKVCGRKRVAIDTTFSPNQSLISNFEELPFVKSSPLVIHSSNPPLNYLHISIEEAKLTKVYHFHGIKPSNPSPYVKIISPNQMDEVPENKEFVTSAVRNENGLLPSWHEHFRVPVFSQIEFVTMQVWSRNQEQLGPTLDTLVGFAKIDISSLWYGLQIDGWYNIVEDGEKSKIVGQIKVTIALDTPTKVSSPQIRHSSDMVKAERFMMKSFDKHIMTITEKSQPTQSPYEQAKENFSDLEAPNDLFYSSVDLENEKAKLKNCLSDLESMINK